MEEEIELRPYIELLVRRWYLIVGAALLAGVVAFGISSLLPPEYEATSIVAITEPRFRVQFEPRIEESDEVLQHLMKEINSSLDEVTNLDELREVVMAESGSDPTLIRLSARLDDPEDAARIVNTWAGIFVTKANEIFGDPGEEQERFFVDQLAEAEEELTSAEDALIAFEALNRLSIIDNELASLRQFQSSYLTDAIKTTFLLQDIEGLREQLEAESGVDVTFADQLTILALQLQAFNADSHIPLQLQLESPESLLTRDRDQQVAFLETMMATLETRLEQIDEMLDGLEPRILALQQQKQETGTESSRLVRDRDIADETYLALARKVEEERISSDELTSVAKLASEASVPEEAESRGRLLNTAFAGFLALILAVVGIIATDWWRRDDSV